MKPVVAIIGRPNVGKSTLFNRIVRRRDAIVDNMPGVTRDRLHGDAAWNERSFTVVDTGGFLSGDDDPFAPHIRRQVAQAVAESDAVLLVLDGRQGLSPYDRDLTLWLRSVRQPVFYVINKIDGPAHENLLHDFYSLGLEPLYPLSAEHGYGLGDLLDAVTASLPVQGEVPDRVDPEEIRVAVVGRPNAGKSSLINRLLGQERLVVSEVPGTTRDAVDTLLRRHGRAYRFIDTAGIRRKAKVDLKLEKFSIIKALKCLEGCDVALIVLDAGQGIADQDIRVAGYAHDRGCGAIFVANKWDLVDASILTPHKFTQRLRETARFLPHAPVLTLSALTGQRTAKLFPMIDEVFRQYTTRIGTGLINRIITEATQRTEPPLHKGRRLKFYYTTQVTERPPTFVTFVNRPDAVHFSYQRYLLNQIRTQTGLDKTPLRILFRQRTGKIDFAGWKKNTQKPRHQKR